MTGAKSKMKGRPSLYTDKLAVRICRRLAEGESFGQRNSLRGNTAKLAASGTLCVDVVYQSLEADAAFAACVGENEGATCVTINRSGIALEKTLQPGKGDIVGGGPDGGFSVGTIVFTPVP